MTVVSMPNDEMFLDSFWTSPKYSRPVLLVRVSHEHERKLI
jgi:hypothetical protein